MTTWFEKGTNEPQGRVFVNGSRIPIINKGIETHIRKGGNASINRRSEVYFPNSWNGEYYGNQLRALDPTNEEVLEPVDVEILNHTTNGFHTVHRGFVKAIGGVSEGSVGRRMVVGDASELLKFIDASKRFAKGATIYDVLNYILSTFAEVQPIFDSISLQVAPPKSSIPNGDYPSEQQIEFNEKLIKRNSFGPSAEKEFTSNRHSLSDVLTWLLKRTDGICGFFPTENSKELAFVYDPFVVPTKQVADNCGGDVRVRKNNALYEISPINTLSVNGRTENVVDKVSKWRSPLATSRYPKVTVEYPPLLERAGTTFKSPTREIDAKDLDDAKRVAKNALKDELDGSSGGDITTDLNGFALPFGKLTSKPSCGKNVDNDVPKLDYEIEEIVHKVGYEKQNGDEEYVDQTTLRVSMYIEKDDIEIVDNKTGFVDK